MAENPAVIEAPPETNAALPDDFDPANEENSLRKILVALTHYESTMDSVDWSTLDLLVEHGKRKVDAYIYVRDHLESRIAYLKKKEKEWAAARKSAEAGLEALIFRATRALLDGGFTSFAGNDYRIDLSQSRYCDIEESNVECSDRHALHYQEFVRVNYEWDKKAITEALKDPDDANPLKQKAQKIAAMKQRYGVTFSVVRDNETGKKTGKKK